MVTKTNTIVDPRAMVVEPSNTMVARLAVLRSDWSTGEARCAERVVTEETSFTEFSYCLWGGAGVFV